MTDDRQTINDDEVWWRVVPASVRLLLPTTKYEDLFVKVNLTISYS